MYKKNDGQFTIQDFISPFGELDAENRWVKLAELIPWDFIEERYANRLSKKVSGAPANTNPWN